MEYQHDSFETDTGSVASELPSEQDKTKELKDKPETLWKQKLWLLIKKSPRKQSQKALSAENIQLYLTNISSYHSSTRGESGKACSRKFYRKRYL